MSSPELKFQRQIIEDVDKAHPHAFAIKMSNRFLAGIPDLLIKVPKNEIVFIEAKVAKVKVKTSAIDVNTTGIQRAILKAMESAGISVAVWVLVDAGEKSGIFRCHWSVTSATIDVDKLIYRPRGQRWPIDELISNPIGM